MPAYYNEFDPFAAAWLRELIKARVIAEGDVDERSIEDVAPRDLRGYTQCHFFAGIGVWSYALRLAGWPDDRPVWTGSCPCQPFSNAGKRKGTADKRHLWPSWFHLVSECKPDTIFGEQVKAAISQGWLDLVSDDLEGIGYSIGAVPFPACSVGAPHIRQRVYFVGHAEKHGHERRPVLANGESSLGITETSISDFMGHSDHSGSQGWELFGATGERNGEGGLPLGPSGPDGLLAHSDGGESSDGYVQRSGQHGLGEENRTAGFWRDADWLYCTDQKYRPVEPGTFPLVNGSANRVGRLRGYGNAIVAPQAQAFIEVYLEVAGQPLGDETASNLKG